MPKRECIICRTLTTGTRCPTHEAQYQRAREQRKGTTTQRGLGHAHRRATAALKATHTDGTSCPWCGQPMYTWQALTGDHSTPRAHGGRTTDTLMHKLCNEQRGDKPLSQGPAAPRIRIR